MFLGAYHFDGDPADLLAGHERLLDLIPPSALDLHLCVERDGGITVFDACPSRDVFNTFSTGPDFTAALQAAGLPTPRIEQLGDVHMAYLRETVRS